MNTAERKTRIDWVSRSSFLLRAIEAEFKRQKPFDGLTIATAIHLEPKTASLLMTLQAGGAHIVATGNLNSTQTETIDFLQDQGIEVIGQNTTDAASHDADIDAMLAHKPDLLLDNGGDMFAKVAEAPHSNLLGGTEETTSGRMRLEPMRAQFGFPILVINDSPIKQFAENRHAVGQSLFESYLRFTNRSTNGKRVTVFGYGACGRGVAACFRNGFAETSVVDSNPVTTLEAHLDGFATPLRDDAVRSADIIITVTGAPDILTEKDLGLIRDGAILMNGGHFPVEIAVDRMMAHRAVDKKEEYEDGITTLHLADGRMIHIIGHGHMANLAGPRPLGNTIESMDLGFTLQARCLEWIAKGRVDPDQCVVPVPKEIDAQVAEDYLALRR